jgi:hypothetical protein
LGRANKSIFKMESLEIYNRIRWLSSSKAGSFLREFSAGSSRRVEAVPWRAPKAERLPPCLLGTRRDRPVFIPFVVSHLRNDADDRP